MKPKGFRLGAKLENAVARLRALPAARWIPRAVPPEFTRWIASNEPAPGRWEGMTGQELPYRPLISIIVPVYRIPREILGSTLRSITRQSYPDWQACVVYADTENQENWELIRRHADGDGRFRVRRLEGNRGISSNSNEALRLATGEFIALLDHDDEIAPWALYVLAKKIAENPDVDFLYSDKDCITEHGSKRLNPLFKPQWSPEMLYSVNYLTHLNVIRRSLVEAVGGFRPETDGAQDWDLFFRVTEQSRRILRVEGVLYHWRMMRTSTSTGAAAKPYAARAQLRTIEDRLRRLSLPADAEPDAESGFRIRWRPSPWQADIVVHSDGGDPSRIERLLSELAQDRVRTVIVAAHPGASPEDFPHGRRCWGPRLKVLPEGLPGSAGGHSSLAQLLSADVVAFVSAEVARCSDEWLSELGGWCVGHSQIAFASALVIGPADRVVEAGAVIGSNARAAPLFYNRPLYGWGFFGASLWYRNCSAAHPWLVAMSRKVLNAAGGLPSAASWDQAFIDLCLRLRADGKRGMVDPHARAYLDAMPPMPRSADPGFAADPYFHPAFSSLNPLSL